MPKIAKPCVVCGAPKLRYPSEWEYSPTPLCSPECRSRHLSRTMQGDQNPDWKGGRYVEPEKGYVMIRQPDHPRARKNGYVLEHILVMEKKLGRPLEPGEEVHHENHIRHETVFREIGGRMIDSEEAIKRHQEKREQEERIARRLQQDVLNNSDRGMSFRNESGFSFLSLLGRQGNRPSGWECPTGCASR